jgi:hypothetical protein
VISAKTPFTFVRTRLIKIPAIECWYLRIRPEDTALYNDIIMGFGGQVFKDPRAPWNDPHMEKERRENKDNWFAMQYFAPNLTKKWVQTLGDFLKDGVTVLLNRKGGMVPLDDHLEILDTKEQDDFRPWPDLPDEETITIKQWAGGKHYYLSSSQGRNFRKVKYDSYYAAKEAARKYVKRDDQIVWEPPDFRYRYEGD